jgi:hypothetical protein
VAARPLHQRLNAGKPGQNKLPTQIKNIMKKIIVLVAITLISVKAMLGQTNFTPSRVVASAFSQQFNGITNVNWSKAGQLTVAQFREGENLLVAYFENDGTLVAKARKISEDQLPPKLLGELIALKTENEKKVGALVIGNIFEYTQDDNVNFVASLEGNHDYIAIGSVNGHMKVRSRSKRDLISPATKDVIAASRH